MAKRANIKKRQRIKDEKAKETNKNKSFEVSEHTGLDLEDPDDYTDLDLEDTDYIDDCDFGIHYSDLDLGDTDCIDCTDDFDFDEDNWFFDDSEIECIEE